MACSSWKLHNAPACMVLSIQANDHILRTTYYAVLRTTRSSPAPTSYTQLSTAWSTTPLRRLRRHLPRWGRRGRHVACSPWPAVGPLTATLSSACSWHGPRISAGRAGLVRAIGIKSAKVKTSPRPRALCAFEPGHVPDLIRGPCRAINPRHGHRKTVSPELWTEKNCKEIPSKPSAREWEMWRQSEK